MMSSIVNTHAIYIVNRMQNEMKNNLKEKPESFPSNYVKLFVLNI